jgi:hypothetical protein
VVEQLADGELITARVSQPELRQVLLDRVLEPEPSGVHELQHREGREGLAQRGDPEQGVAGDRCPGRIVPVAAYEQHPVPSGDGDSGAGGRRRRHSVGQITIDRRDDILRTVLVGEGGGRCRDGDRKRGQCEGAPARASTLAPSTRRAGPCCAG